MISHAIEPRAARASVSISQHLRRAPGEALRAIHAPGSLPPKVGFPQRREQKKPGGMLIIRSLSLCSTSGGSGRSLGAGRPPAARGGSPLIQMLCPVTNPKVHPQITREASQAEYCIRDRPQRGEPERGDKIPRDHTTENTCRR
jgi:hypothetical protein